MRTLLFLLQTMVPVTCLVWLWLGRASGRLSSALRAWTVLGALAALVLVTSWLDVPPWVGYAWLILWMAAAVGGWRRASRRDAVEATTGRRVTAGVVVVAGALGWTAAAVAVDGRRLPGDDAVDLACPLGPAAYRVVSGGSRQIVNAHLTTLEATPRFAPWRGQSYGVDLVQVDGFGRRARRLFSPNLSDYFIYGQQVLAPCDGRVVAAIDGRPDMPVGARDPDRTQLAGNHVVLACGMYEVLLAHLQPGSVRAEAGDVVLTGHLLGFVGNSGNTDEPHLHVSAQRRIGDEPPIGGEPVWITIEGVFGVRNDRLRCE